MRYKVTLKLTLPYILILGSLVGIVAASVLIYDQVKIWQNPNFAAPCSLNPIISCGSVINSGQGHILGVPAPFFGLVMFSSLITFGILLLSGAKFKKWVWLGVQLAVTGGVVLALWLFWLSLYKIHALCPYCLATDAAVYVMAWYVTLHNVEQGYILQSSKLHTVKIFCRKHHLDLIIAVFLILIAFTLHHFWYYYGRFVS